MSDGTISETDSEQWTYENAIDTYDGTRKAAEKAKADADPFYIAELYWQMRRISRKFRAARGKFHPRRRRGRRTFLKRKGFRKGTKRGFFLGEHFIDLSHIPEEEREAFFGGKRRSRKPQLRSRRRRSKKVKTAMQFFAKMIKRCNCGENGRMAKDCKKPRACFGCGQPVIF